MSKKLIGSMCIILFISSIFSGCLVCQTNEPQGFIVYSMTSSLGGVNENNFDFTKYSYSIELTNENLINTKIISVEPILKDSIRDMVLDDNLAVDVNKIVSPGDTITIEGALIIDTKGLSKDEILNLEPFIAGIKVNSKTTIDFNY